jgi:threonine dehydrogenase-like Zn-dependent dehydrogenase
MERELGTVEYIELVDYTSADWFLARNESTLIALGPRQRGARNDISRGRRTRRAAENGTMKACVLCDVGRIEVREVEKPKITARDVLVRISSVGICGTDTHIFAGHANYNTDEGGKRIPLTVHPQILGHEISGVIEETGSEVRELKAGDRVVIDQGLNCSSAGREEFCEYCATGDSHQCEFYREHGITGLPGGLAEFIAVPAKNAVRLTGSLDMSLAALAEPLGCIIHTTDTVLKANTRYRIGGSEKRQRVKHILICGGGPAGLLFTQYLRKVLGYDGLLMVSEPNAIKQKLVKSFGADVVIDPTKVDVGDAVREHTKGGGVELMLEASGQGQSFAAIPTLIRKQATVVLYGHGHAGVDLSVLNSVMFKEPALITPIGASGGFEKDGRPSVYARGLRLIEKGDIQVAPFITHRYKALEEVQGALAGGMSVPEYVKGVVVLNPN